MPTLGKPPSAKADSFSLPDPTRGGREVRLVWMFIRFKEKVGLITQLIKSLTVFRNTTISTPIVLKALCHIIKCYCGFIMFFSQVWEKGIKEMVATVYAIQDPLVKLLVYGKPSQIYRAAKGCLIHFQVGSETTCHANRETISFRRISLPHINRTFTIKMPRQVSISKCGICNSSHTSILDYIIPHVKYFEKERGAFLCQINQAVSCA